MQTLGKIRQDDLNTLFSLDMLDWKQLMEEVKDEMRCENEKYRIRLLLGYPKYKTVREFMDLIWSGVPRDEHMVNTYQKAQDIRKIQRVLSTARKCHGGSGVMADYDVLCAVGRVCKSSEEYCY